jgi:hypothetical protein
MWSFNINVVLSDFGPGFIPPNYICLAFGGCNKTFVVVYLWFWSICFSGEDNTPHWYIIQLSEVAVLINWYDFIISGLLLMSDVSNIINYILDKIN